MFISVGLATVVSGCTKSTFFVGVEGEEPMLGSGMLSTRSRMFWIFWSEILMCRSGSSPDTLNLKTSNISHTTCMGGGGTQISQQTGHLESYLGILASFSTIHLASWTVKSIGWRIC